MSNFKLVSKFAPAGDQPKAIEKMVKNIKADKKHQVLLGVTGSGKTFSLCGVIEKIQKPTLIISHNKTLAAQLYQEFRDFFPNNAVHYFVSYYDYYQPEAYIPQTDTYIEKDASINQQIDQMRHAAVQDLVSRKDVIIVASVSCIYNIGSPDDYQKVSFEIKKGEKIKRQDFLRKLASLLYERNDTAPMPGNFRARGDMVEVFTSTGEKIIKVEFFGDTIEKISQRDSSLGTKESQELSTYHIFPAKFWVSPEEKIKIALKNIENDLEERVTELKKQDKLLEAKRLTQRTNYDLEMIQNMGYCHGIENYSRYFEARLPDSTPFCLLEYFPRDYLTIIDESHITIPQLKAMYNTDKARKNVLIEHGFRLPSCLDNRPLKFEEFQEKAGKVVYVSATPGEYEIDKIKSNMKNLLVEQLVRPTGLLEPAIEIRKTQGQVPDLIEEIKKTTSQKQRTLVITLTKRMAEELASYLKDKDIKAEYLHSEIKTLERPKILNDLREGKIDVIIGINLLREGLDLPEVALVAILDADKEGFLRNETTLIQTMGRASRNLAGRVILYADKMTGSMKSSINEIARRRRIQEEYNKKNNIDPQAIIKEIKQWQVQEKESSIEVEFEKINDIKILESEMKQAAESLDFERAAEIRDLIKTKV